MQGSKKKAAAVSMLATAAVASSASSSSHSITMSLPHSTIPPSSKNTPCCSNSNSPPVDHCTRYQAAQFESLQRIPRGGSSTERDAAKETSSRVGGKDNKSSKSTKKKKRGTTNSSSNSNSGSSRSSGGTDSNINDNGKRHSKASSSKDTAFDDTASNTSSNEAETASSSSQQSSSSSSSSTLPPAAQSILTQTCHYDILGITKSATSTEIQKAYRRRCVLTHPDKTQGDRSAFDKVSEAYDVLSCEKKRAIYDKFGLEGLNDDFMENGRNSGGGFGGGGGGFNDVFREFFGGGMSGMGFGTQFHHQQGPNNGGGRSSSSSSSFGPRNRDLRYQLEVSLEDLYNGTTKHIAIQQPNPLRPHFPLRKEVEVSITKGMHSGQSVRLSGVVDSIPDAAPADVVFLITQRRHPVYTRKGSDLAIEVRLTLAEAIVGFKKKIRCLDGREIVIGNPYEVISVRKEELVDAPSLPDLIDDDAVDDIVGDDVEEECSNKNNSTRVTTSSSLDDAVPTTTATIMDEFPIQQIVKTTTISYNLPSKIIQTGDVHVLKGKGMPLRGGVGGHDYGDLYVQYIVELPGGQTSSPSSSSSQISRSQQLNTNNLTAQERVELARLLSKLEGKDDPTTDVIKVWEEGTSETTKNNNNNNNDVDNVNGETVVHRLSVSSASEFGRSSSYENNNGAHYDNHFHADDDDEDHHHRGMNNFFHRAFHNGGRSHSTSGFSGPFGFGSSSSSGASSSGFRYYSSSSMGGSRGGPVYGDEDGHNDVQCQQM